MVWTGSQKFIGRGDKKNPLCQWNVNRNETKRAFGHILVNADFKWRRICFLFLSLLPLPLLRRKEIPFFLLSYQSSYINPLKLSFCIYIYRGFVQRYKYTLFNLFSTTPKSHCFPGHKIDKSIFFWANFKCMCLFLACKKPHTQQKYPRTSKKNSLKPHLYNINNISRENISTKLLTKYFVKPSSVKIWGCTDTCTVVFVMEENERS